MQNLSFLSTLMKKTKRGTFGMPIGISQKKISVTLESCYKVKGAKNKHRISNKYKHTVSFSRLFKSRWIQLSIYSLVYARPKFLNPPPRASLYLTHTSLSHTHCLSSSLSFCSPSPQIKRLRDLREKIILRIFSYLINRERDSEGGRGREKKRERKTAKGREREEERA